MVRDFNKVYSAGKNVPPEFEDILDHYVKIDSPTNLFNNTKWSLFPLFNETKNAHFLKILHDFSGDTVNELWKKDRLKTYDPFSKDPKVSSLNPSSCFLSLKDRIHNHYQVDNYKYESIERLVYRLSIGKKERLWGTLVRVSKESIKSVLFTPYLWDPNHTIWWTVGANSSKHICIETCDMTDKILQRKCLEDAK